MRQRSLLAVAILLFSSINKVVFFFSVKGYRVYKQNNTWLLVDMKFLFSCSTRHRTRSLCSPVSYRFKHSERNPTSTHVHVLLSIYNSKEKLILMMIMPIIIIIIKTRRSTGHFICILDCRFDFLIFYHHRSHY